jgi:putative tryptophan/tyrosine transport system substrate-binding protein
MKRREFISLLGAAAAAWPLAVRAQPTGGMRKIGVLMALADGDPGGQAEVDALRQGLREHGWIEGRNVHVDYRWPGGDIERARAFAKEVVGFKPDVLMARSTPATLALKAETGTIPIVFVSVAEPTSSGLVVSLARPGGNITGFTNFEASIGGKLLELLQEVSPSLKRAAFIYNPNTAPYAQSYLRSAEAAATVLGVESVPSPVQNDADIETVLTTLARAPGGGLVGIPDTFLQQRRELIIALVDRYRLPAIYATRVWAPSGGLMAYAVDTLDLIRRAAGYIDRILKGAHPGELPVQQPNKYELVINLKTAKAQGLQASDKLLALADEVIE